MYLLITGIAASMVSCSGSDVPETDTTDTETAAPVETETVSYLDTLPVENLSGYTFNTIGQSTFERQNFYMEEKDGDVINDAIHQRDLIVSERLNAELSFIAYEGRAQVGIDVTNNVLADDATYTMAITAMSDGIGYMVSGGVCYDLNEIPHLTIEGGLWDASIHENMSFLGKQYFTTGVISAQFSQSPVCCVFNKRLAEMNKLNNIYDIVLEGKWTIDFMEQCMKETAQDVDGDGVMTIDDFYGFALDGVFGNVLYAAAGYNPIVENDGVYSVNLADARMVDIIDKCARIFGDPNITWHNTQSDGSSRVVFHEGRSIFLTCDMLDAQKLRDMEDDFGIIPTPKYEESQTQYITSCTTWLPTGIVVPKNCREVEKVGLIMETMAAAAEETIVPAVYDVTLQGKVSRDEKSTQMLDIIFENPSYDFITAFNFGGSGPALRSAVLGWSENWVSTWAGMQKSVEKEINNIMEIAK